MTVAIVVIKLEGIQAVVEQWENKSKHKRNELTIEVDDKTQTNMVVNSRKKYLAIETCTTRHRVRVTRPQHINRCEVGNLPMAMKNNDGSELNINESIIKCDEVWREKEGYREEENGKGSTSFISIVYSWCHTCSWGHKPVLYCHENTSSKKKIVCL